MKDPGNKQHYDAGTGRCILTILRLMYALAIADSRDDEVSTIIDHTKEHRNGSLKGFWQRFSDPAGERLSIKKERDRATFRSSYIPYPSNSHV